MYGACTVPPVSVIFLTHNHIARLQLTYIRLYGSARMAELADARDLGSRRETCGGSSPPSRNIGFLFSGGLFEGRRLRTAFVHPHSRHRNPQGGRRRRVQQETLAVQKGNFPARLSGRKSPARPCKNQVRQIDLCAGRGRHRGALIRRRLQTELTFAHQPGKNKQPQGG